jgi:SAM-dependent methyltransferase
MINTQPDNKKIYDDSWSEWIDMKRYGPASRWLHSLIRRHFKTIEKTKIPVNSILDVGCGDGAITKIMGLRLPQAKVVGIDFSQKGIDCAKQFYTAPNVSYFCDNDSVKLKEKYDLITAFEVLEHLPSYDDLLSRMADASNKFLMFSFPTGRMRPFEVNVGHYRNFKIGEAEAFLEKKGFVPLSIFYAGFPFYSPLYREWCNLTNSAHNSFTRGSYGFMKKVAGASIAFAFEHLSTRHRLGDQFCGLFIRKELLKR